MKQKMAFLSMAVMVITALFLNSCNQKSDQTQQPSGTTTTPSDKNAIVELPIGGEEEWEDDSTRKLLPAATQWGVTVVVTEAGGNGKDFKVVLREQPQVDPVYIDSLITPDGGEVVFGDTGDCPSALFKARVTKPGSPGTITVSNIACGTKVTIPWP